MIIQTCFQTNRELICIDNYRVSKYNKTNKAHTNTFRVHPEDAGKVKAFQLHGIPSENKNMYSY